MERFLMIKEQLPMRERSYTDQQGQQKVFVSVGFVLTRPGSDAPRGI